MKKFFNKVQNKANELAIIRDRRREVVVLILLSLPIRYIGLNSKELTFSLPYRLIHRLIPILRDLIRKRSLLKSIWGATVNLTPMPLRL